MNGPFLMSVFTRVGTGSPKVPVLALSSRAMHRKFTCPNAMMSASHSSTVWSLLTAHRPL